jgi:glycosyltransferase involved in cell wall biosynthesis
MKNPLVSIVTPTFNRPHFLNLVLECVLAQTYDNLEWIIMDDSDIPNHTFQNKLSNNMKYIHLKDKLSVGEKRNKLIEASSGDFIIQFDDDDFYGPGYIAKLFDVLQSKNADFLLMDGFYCFHLDKKILGYYKTRIKKGLAYKFFNNGIDVVDLEKMNIPWIHLCFGWSYFFKKKVWEKSPFQSVNVFEDRSFLMQAIKNEFKAIFFEDLEGIAFHSVHKKSSSVCFPQYVLPAHLNEKVFQQDFAKVQNFLKAATL